MNEDLQLSVADTNTEQQLATDEQKPVTGESSTPEVTETDEEKNLRIQQEATEKARQKEEKRQQSVQRRFDELTADKYAERKRADQLAEQNAKILALLEGKQGGTAKPTGEPTREQFTDYEDFVTARAEYRAELKAQAMLDNFARTQQQESAKASEDQSKQAAERSFVERRAAAEKDIPDYRQVVEDWEPQLPDSVVDLIVRMPDGPLISYHMAKNPALERQFREQPAYMHGILLGQISAGLKSPQQKTVSAAPAPGKPVGTKVASSSGDGYSGDPEGYYAWAQKHMK